MGVGQRRVRRRGCVSAPRVSVLMTTRDGAAWIGESLASVFAQTMTDFELVVVDDGSTDATPAMLAAVRDPRIRVLRHEASSGIAGGRNAGLELCRGAYVAVLDHDDVSLPARLQAQADFLDRHAAVMFVGSAVRILADGVSRESGQPLRVGSAGLRMLLHLGNALTWSSVMFRRDALMALAADGPVLRETAEPADDFDLYHRLLRTGEGARLDEVLTLYRAHAGSATHRLAERMLSRATTVLAEAYAPCFGEAAQDAAVLAVRHLGHRAPVPDAATLDRVLAVIARVADLHDTAEGRLLADEVAWRLVRAAVRGGRPWLLRRRGGWVDTGVSVGVGAVRASKQGLLFLKKKNQKNF